MTSTGDRYTDATTLICPDTARVRLQISNAAIKWQRGKGSPPAWDEPEADLLPIVGAFDQVCDAVRVRSLTPGVPAVVAIDALTASEVGDG